MRFLPVNLDALLVELDDLPQTLALLASLRSEPLPGIEEIVPAARTLLVRYRPATVRHRELVALISGRSLTAPEEKFHESVEIPVDYSGEDLDDVAQLLGLSTAEVVRRHTACEYTVAFTGFAPGFAYLSGGDPALVVPRRATPRTRIPAGAVGLAGPFSGVYPKASPGGWQIIGCTDASMWDLARDVPALLQPGFKVRFVDATGRLKPNLAPIACSRAVAPASTCETVALAVKRTGLQALFQDAGRTGQAAQGVSASGAMDRSALRMANRLVGNASDTPCLELVDGGFQIASMGEAVVALAGAETTLTVTRRSGTRVDLPSHQAIALSDGDSLTLGEPRAGIRSYLAVRGGFEVQQVLGSCATDTLAALGPAPIQPGDLLSVRPVLHGAVVGWPEPVRDDLPTAQATVTLDLVLGPRTDWFTGQALALLTTQLWRVTPQSNRVGLRLQGEAPLTRAITGELPSEGTVRGAVQVPPSGQPVLFMADHPLTGGYPVIGCVAPHHLDRAGQIPIGAAVRFRPIQPFFSDAT